MPEFDLIFEMPSSQRPPQIPQEWILMVNRLNPVTAAVVWQVLTSTVTPSTITLAQNSPDVGRFLLVNIVARGNPNDCEDVTQMARMEIDEIFDSTIPGFKSHKIIH